MNRLRKIVVLAALAVLSQSTFAKETIKLVFISSGTYETVADVRVRIAWSEMLQSSEEILRPSIPFDRLALSYTVDHHVGSGSSTVAINEFRYIPSTADSPGYVYFANVRGGWASTVGSWRKLKDGADREVKELLGHQEMIK